MVQRSPRCPFISLADAVERARQLQALAKRSWVTVATAAGAWELAESSSSVSQTIAALKQYGLVDDGRIGAERSVRLRERALAILLDERPGSPERQRALGDAALTPTIFHELWTRFLSEEPSDVALRTYLTINKKFSDTAVDRVIANYRATLGYAGMTGDPRKGDEASDEPSAPSGFPTGRSTAGRGSGRRDERSVEVSCLPLGDGLTLRLVLEDSAFTKRHAEVVQRVVAFARDQLIGE